MDAIAIYALFLAFAGLFVLGCCRLSGAADDTLDERCQGDWPHVPGVEIPSFHDGGV